MWKSVPEFVEILSETALMLVVYNKNSGELVIFPKEKMWADDEDEFTRQFFGDENKCQIRKWCEKMF